MKKIIFFALVSFFIDDVNAQNVGIGNSSPKMKLHVTGTDSAVGLLENTQALDVNVSTALYFKTGSGSFPYTGAIKTTGEGTAAARLGLFTYASTSANQLLERLSITDKGDVGIGTISPLAKLHVVKNDSTVAIFENTQALNTGVSNAMYFKTGSGTLSYTGAIKTIGDGSGVARLGLFTYASFSGSGLKERVSITDAGNVGIGVTTPQTALHINPNGAGSLLIGTNRTSGGYTTLELGINAQSNGYGYVQATKTSGSTYGSLALNPNGGNVGIGTATPTSTLDVHGGISLPIKIITANYTVTSDDYTVVADFQNVLTHNIDIYLPGTFSSAGRIIKIVAINQPETGGSLVVAGSPFGYVHIFQSGASDWFAHLSHNSFEDIQENGSGGVFKRFLSDGKTAVTLQCTGTALGWIEIDNVSSHYYYEDTYTH
jgi:hypothetical protein